MPQVAKRQAPHDSPCDSRQQLHGWAPCTVGAIRPSLHWPRHVGAGRQILADRRPPKLRHGTRQADAINRSPQAAELRRRSVLPGGVEGQA